MKKTIVWALFDSGNGCYKQAIERYFAETCEVYCVGMDKENKHDHFIHLDLADSSELFGDSCLFERLDQLPKPDIILASPPCECWSTSTNIKDGSIYWKRPVVRTLFGEDQTDDFALVPQREMCTKTCNWAAHPKYSKLVYSRINGELCAYNTTRIIKRYKPRVFVIENPANGKLWRYYRHILNFSGIKNIVCYNDYEQEFSQKPTCFYSNLKLNLKLPQYKPSEYTIGNTRTGKKAISGYNRRSNIPLTLIRDILSQCL